MNKENEILFEALNNIATCLAEGMIWHQRSSIECNKLAIKGWAEWHRVESIVDKHSYDKFDKILIEHLMYKPFVNIKKIEQAYKYEIPTMNDFKIHHKIWVENEKQLVQYLNEAIDESKEVDMKLYKKLCKMVEEVQHEIALVRMTYNNLELAGWMGHDISVKSKWIKDYFDLEYCYGDTIRFNIG